MILRRNQKNNIQSDTDHIDDYLDKLTCFDYNQMLFSGAKYEILDFGKPSMYAENDAIEKLEHCFKRSLLGRSKPFSIEEENLVTYISKLKMPDIIEKKSLEVSSFSGITNAKSNIDYGTLKEYGASIVNDKNNNYFESADYFNKLMDEVIYSGSVNSAIYHTWTGRLYFDNKNYSHRLAQINYLAISQKINTKIEFNVSVKQLNIDCAKYIYDNYIGIITTKKTYVFLSEQIKALNIEILLEKPNLEGEILCILWFKKINITKLNAIVEFVSQLPSNKCFIISNVLMKYI
jgi:hypothetical protein